MAQSSIRILADECISTNLVKILKHVGIRCIYPFNPEFDNGIADEKWVPEAIRRNYICLSCDRKMLVREQIAMFISKQTARMIFLPSYFTKIRLRQQLIWILQNWNKIETFAITMEPGTIAIIDRRGNIRQIESNNESLLSSQN